jgi:DNA-binding NtrC family response regulator
MVLDLQLANMDGLDVFRAACDLPSPPATILHSAYLSVQTAVLAIRSGVGEVLEKPVLEDVLVARIRELTARRRAKLAEPNGADSGDAASGAGDSSRAGVDSSGVIGLGGSRSLPDLERTLILQAFADSGQNLSRAARTLGIPRSTLRDRLRKYGAR